jgi:hypothetical protein
MSRGRDGAAVLAARLKPCPSRGTNTKGNVAVRCANRASEHCVPINIEACGILVLFNKNGDQP